MEDVMGNGKKAGSDPQEINISDILYLIMRMKWIILIVTVIFAAAGFIYSSSTYIATYSATASMIVNAKQQGSTYVSDQKSPDSSDIYLAQKLVSTYELVLKSNRVMEYVVKKLDTNIPASVISSYISLNAAADTQVLYLTVTSPDPKLSMNIANTLMEVAPKAMTETVEIGSINILDQATLPVAPNAHSTARDIALFGLVGLFLSFGLTVLFGLIFFKIKNSDDIEERLTISPLGEIMHIGHKERQNGILLSSEGIPPYYVESYMMLAAMVSYISSQKNTQKILITSTQPDEGKTSVSINLAMALAKSGKKVILIDCDLRKPSIHRILDISREDAGYLYDSFKDSNALAGCIYEAGNGLSVIPFLSRFEYHYDLFSSKEFTNAVDELAKAYDCVIFDSAPANTITDSINLARISDGVIMVVRQDQAPERIINDTLEKLRAVGANILGCVLNDIRHHNMGSGYTSKYYYYAKKGYHYNAGIQKDDKMISFNNQAQDEVSLKPLVTKHEKPKWALLFFAFAALFAVLFFSFMRGDRLSALNRKTVVLLAPYAQSIVNAVSGAISGTSNSVNYTGPAAINSTAQAMASAIHVILFFIASLTLYLVLKGLKIKPLINLAATTAFCLGTGYLTEMLQNNVVGRGYENIDVVNNCIGVGCGLVIFLIVLVFSALCAGKSRRLSAHRPVSQMKDTALINFKDDESVPKSSTKGDR